MKWHNVAKDVHYNFRPELDHDTIVSQQNLENAEVTLGRRFEGYGF